MYIQEILAWVFSEENGFGQFLAVPSLKVWTGYANVLEHIFNHQNYKT